MKVKMCEIGSIEKVEAWFHYTKNIKQCFGDLLVVRDPDFGFGVLGRRKREFKQSVGRRMLCTRLLSWAEVLIQVLNHAPLELYPL